MSDFIPVEGGYPLDWLEEPKKASDLICGICKKLCRDAMELSCPEHSRYVLVSWCPPTHH